MQKDSIGVFDSGVGGLTVLKSLIELLPDENFIYFGDIARLPYGTKSDQTIKRYGFQDASFLIEKGVKLIVVASNTVSSVALESLQENFDIPIIGVIEPAAKVAVSIADKSLGIIGTAATIKSEKYIMLCQKFAQNEGKSLSILQKPTSLLVPFIEDGWKDSNILELVIKEYFKDFIEKVDTLVLGCTHYPIIQDKIQSICGKNIKIINSANAVAYEVKRTLEKNKIENIVKNKKNRDVRLYVSDFNDTVFYLTELILGNKYPLKKIELVDIFGSSSK